MADVFVEIATLKWVLENSGFLNNEKQISISES